MSATSKVYSAFETYLNFHTVDAIFIGSKAWEIFRTDPRLTKNFVPAPHNHQLGKYCGIPLFSDILQIEDSPFLESNSLVFVDKPVQNLDSINSLADFIQALHDQNLVFNVVKIPDLTQDEIKIPEWGRSFLTLLEFHPSLFIETTTMGYRLTVDCYEREGKDLHQLIADAFSEL